MSEYIVELPMSGAADEFIAKHGVDDCRLYGYKLTGEIVRCRDCKHFCEDRRDTSIGWVDVFVCDSEQWSTSSIMPSHKVQPNGYCAWGERKEESE